ncbi:reticulocyte-binding protein homolog 2a [Episyrphus balteatus]|uniref:reticulocyte-binding protein homolog 2a n=1 Tax=Episyrphus balteatus TaxID=286459 RepID=UPI0024863D0B|nr:reticulocyte-binding protein homolog 2a [Episyrphus balteatus]
MSRQLWLVVLVVAISATTLMATTTTEEPSSHKSLQEGDNRIETPSEVPIKAKKLSTLKIKKPINATTTNRPTKPEKDGLSKNIPLASDPRYNKMLPESVDHLNDVLSNTTEKDDDDYYYDYEDYSYDENSENKTSTTASIANEEEIIKKLTTTSTAATPSAVVKTEKIPKLKPIKGEEKITMKLNTEQSLDDGETDDEDDNDNDNEDLADEDDKEYDDEDDDDDDDISDEEELNFSNENVPCPRDCVCARNINSYVFATCSRLDLDKQKFGPGITDLIVADVGPKYPILLGPEFFVKIGLKYISSIKISNCTIEYMHENAFHGLDDLYSVNLTNVGLTIINPNTFVENKKLRIMTISGNDLSVMSNVHYLLKSESIEDLDLSRNNLMELKPHAFSELSKIVYINLARNELKELPEGIFDTVETIEELDLSYNALKVLPRGVFNRTALGILHLKYNEISSDLNFGASELQQLDLSYCSIKQIHHGMFDKMTQLTNLNLKGNGITKIQPDSFLQLKNLRHIDLSINELDQVSSLLFYKNSELDDIRLNDNPRLSQLPTDGFQSFNKFFNIRMLDVSNCAIGALGHKTFATMPNLVTLRLAWNNINNLGRDAFAALNKLVELDLSNNLIDKLDDLIFMNNNDMSKLNLAGNPIRKLPTRLFMPFTKLKELDVSECDLHFLLNDNSNGMSHQYKFFETLRSFNASANQIRKISTEDIKPFKNLRTLDISHNPLKCNEELKGMIVYATMKNILPVKVPTMANLDATTFTENVRPTGWDELAQEVCKHSSDAFKPKEQTMEEIKKDILKGDDIDMQKLFYKQEQREEQQLIENAKKAEEEERKLKEIIKMQQDKKMEEEKKLQDDLAEDTSADEDTEEDNDEEDTYDDDEEDKEDETESTKPSVHDLGFNAKEVDLSRETKDKFLLNKLLLDGDNDEDDEDNEDDDSEEIIIERGRIYYNGYTYFIPALIMVTCVIVFLLAIGKFVSLMMRKRGERYRMALLASKNSIVYQKLSEDIIKTNPCKQPKIHKYSPINQV